MSIEGTRRSLRVSWTRYFVAAILAISIIVQLAVVWEHYVSSWSPRIWSLRNLPAWSRAGYLSRWVGEESTRFFGFVRDSVPENTTLFAPQKSVGSAYSLNLMQYFLFPRKLTICSEDQVEACVLAGLEMGAYFLVIDGFPPGELFDSQMQFLPHDDGLGVYEPRPSASSQESTD